MRLLHTSDWHVGRKIRGRSRADEHRAVLSEIVGIARDRRVDITLVAGDLFDISSPSPEDETIVYRALLDLAEVGPVLVVGGNHDSAARLEAVKPLLDLGRITVVARPTRPIDGGVAVIESLGLKVACLPFVSQRGIIKAAEIMDLDPDQHAQGYEERLRRIIAGLTEDMGTDTVNVFTGHLTVYGAESGGGERDAHIFGYAIPPQAFPGGLSYVALGHLHRQQRIPASAPVWYSGSPMQLDFGEVSDEKGVLVVEAEPGKPASVEEVVLESGTGLVQIRGTLEQVLSRAAEVEGSYVKILLDEQARAGLNEEVREAIPGAVDVIIAQPEEKAPRERIERVGRSPAGLLEAYLSSKGVDDPAVVELFRELEEEVLAQVRPQRLVMEGFLAYRRKTEIDFTDADLFVLSGPTGSGKSSVIDGMTFALYGSIPRVGKGSVAPLISAQADSCRVEFRFSVGDETYTAVRLMVRQGSGATTTEARLLRGEGQEVMAGTAAEVTDAVTDLLGLRYEHFIKAVVLPQGAFADFLTDQPSDRQDLLNALLDMGLYEQVMQLANQRAKLAEGRAKSVGESMAKLEVASPDQIEEARQRLGDLAQARVELPARLEDMGRLEAQLGEARSRQVAAVEGLRRLQAIEVPGDLETLGTDMAAAAQHLDSVEKELAAAVESNKEMDEALSVHPKLGDLESDRADRLLLRDLNVRRSELSLESLTTTVGQVTVDRDDKRRSLEALRVAHAAHDLRSGLAIGDTCPVCHSVVATMTEETDGPDISLDQLATELREMEGRADRARDGLKEAEGQAKQIDRQLEDVQERLEGKLDLDALDGAITTVRELVESREAAERAVMDARLAVEQARIAVADLGERGSGLRDALLAVRDQIAAEKPPRPGDDAIEAWRRFDIWLAERTAARVEELADLEKAVDTATEGLAKAQDEQLSWLELLGISSTESPDRDLALAEERRRAEIEEMEKTIVHARELNEELGVEMGHARVASSLGNHLKANNFEAWLLEEAMDVLIDGANRLLDELSGGSYSLRVKKSQFEVVDHRNARLTRTTRTLSGGETFLVALSLALTMAEQLAELTGMSSRLESVFLDEGFGALDQESLDVVASVLDELVGRGRTVGIVTHVRELAERMPVRFEVTKGPETSSIVRVGE